MLKIIYYFVLSVIVMGLFHWTYQSIQDSFSYDFSFSKVKKTDKLFDLVEESIQKERASGDGGGGAIDDLDDSMTPYPQKDEKEHPGSAGGEEGEGKRGEEMENEDLFQFIDGL